MGDIYFFNVFLYICVIITRGLPTSTDGLRARALVISKFCIFDCVLFAEINSTYYYLNVSELCIKFYASIEFYKPSTLM